MVQRREQLAYEQHLSRRSYAYGVDLRRAGWLDHSSLGEPMMRAVDRRWNTLVEKLAAEELQPPNTAAPSELLEPLAKLVRLLHAPLPSVRLLRPSVAKSWPVVTPLGTTKGGSHWLIIDGERLRRQPTAHQTFLLASGLGALHCGHGSLFAAHLMAHRQSRGMGLLAKVLKAWAKVSVFSSDRAALVALGDLEPTLEALRAHADPGVAWHPAVPEASVRVRALEDFDRSRLMVGLRLNPDRDAWSLAPTPPKPPEVEAQADEPTSEDADSVVDSVAEAEAEAEKMEAEAEAEAEESRTRATLDEELFEKAKTIEKALREAWPVTRCDARLTRRLGLL